VRIDSALNISWCSPVGNFPPPQTWGDFFCPPRRTFYPPRRTLMDLRGQSCCILFPFVDILAPIDGLVTRCSNSTCDIRKLLCGCSGFVNAIRTWYCTADKRQPSPKLDPLHKSFLHSWPLHPSGRVSLCGRNLRHPVMTIVPARPTGACQTNCGTGAGMSDNGDGYSTPPDETVVYDGRSSAMRAS
jgi:hypothetical protein